MRGKWAATGLEVFTESVSPYTASEADWHDAADRLADKKPDLVVMDCLGFNERARAIFRDVTGVPTILPRSILGRVTGELLAGGLDG
jgi:protein AroM